MVFGDKLFDEIGNISGFKVTKVHPVEGVRTEVSFISHIKGEGKYPSGENLGSGTLTKYPHGIIDGVYQGSMTITKSGNQFMWWAHEKSKVTNEGKIRGLTIMTGFTNSELLSWMNNLIIAVEVDGSIYSQEFKATGYEWK
jgi:hypothetical protein